MVHTQNIRNARDETHNRRERNTTLSGLGESSARIVRLDTRNGLGDSESDDGGDRMSRLKEQWTKIAQRLRAELGEDLYSSWFARMEIEGMHEAIVHVSVPTRFLRNWVQSHYFDKLLDLCAAELGTVENVEISVRPRGKPIRSSSGDMSARPADHRRAQPRGTPEQPCQGQSWRAGGAHSAKSFDHSLTFQTFVVGKSNALAHAAAVRVAEADPGMPVGFNPLYLHSASGLGKSHLLNAISRHISQNNPERRVLYITAERFMYHFKAALDAKDTLSFKDRFQGLDVLLVDDFQFLQGKAMHQEFYHTFNSLVDSGRQVIIAADLPPAQLENIDNRMRSRLAGGLVLDIVPPELELRRDILRQRLEDASRRIPALDVPDDVIEFLANRITGGGRELEGALTRVIATLQLTKSAITVDMAAIAIRDLVNPTQGQRVKIDDILRIVGRHYNVPKADLLSPRRARSIVRPRQIGMYLAKTLTTRSLPEIGRRFGGRDHSTVLHAVRKIESLIKADEKLAREVTLLVRLLEQA